MSIASERARRVLRDTAASIATDPASLPLPQDKRGYYATCIEMHASNISNLASLSATAAQAISELLYHAYQLGYLDGQKTQEGEK